jgi:hypothetical protein
MDSPSLHPLGAQALLHPLRSTPSPSLTSSPRQPATAMGTHLPRARLPCTFTSFVGFTQSSSTSASTELRSMVPHAISPPPAADVYAADRQQGRWLGTPAADKKLSSRASLPSQPQRSGAARLARLAWPSRSRLVWPTCVPWRGLRSPSSNFARP